LQKKDKALRNLKILNKLELHVKKENFTPWTQFLRSEIIYVLHKLNFTLEGYSKQLRLKKSKNLKS